MGYLLFFIFFKIPNNYNSIPITGGNQSMFEKNKIKNNASEQPFLNYNIVQAQDN